LHDELEKDLLQRGQHRPTPFLGYSSLTPNVFEEVVTTQLAKVALDGVTTGLAARVTLDGVQD